MKNSEHEVIKLPGLTANGVTASVIKYCTFRGWHAERVNVTGRQKYDHKQKKMVWIKANSRRGSADIHAIINGRAVMIEVKVGKDPKNNKGRNGQNRR